MVNDTLLSKTFCAPHSNLQQSSALALSSKDKIFDEY